MKLTHEKCNQ